MSRKSKNWFWLRVALSVALLVVILTKVDTARLIDLFTSVDPLYIALALFLILLDRALLSYKWNLLLATRKLQLSYIKVLKLYFVSSFIGWFLPSAVGGDLFRSYCLYKHNSRLAESVSSVLVERILALFAALTLAVAAVLLFSSALVDQSHLAAILVTAGILILSTVLLLNRKLMHGLINCLSYVRLDKVQRKALRLYDSLSSYRDHRGTLLYVLFLSYFFQVIRIFTAYVVYLSIGTGVGAIYFFIFVPIIMVFATIPITFAGVGVREGAYVYFFSQVGMPTSEAFTLSVLIYLLTLVSVLPGGLLYALEGAYVKDRKSLDEEEWKLESP